MRFDKVPKLILVNLLLLGSKMGQIEHIHIYKIHWCLYHSRGDLRGLPELFRYRGIRVDGTLAILDALLESAILL